VCRLRASSGHCYLKVHKDRAAWEREVHGYERWGPAFGSSAPPLFGVHEHEPLALLLGALPGRILQDVQLTTAQEEVVWHAAGRALAGLHRFADGPFFGPCKRDGTSAGTPIEDAVAHVEGQLDRQIAKGVEVGYVADEHVAVVKGVRELVGAFEGEKPVPCHRDYCPANWLVTDEGVWTGVIDFEFSRWDVRVADFSRYPDWEWMAKPHLLEALFDGYGRRLTATEEQQQLVARAQYALEAVVWGCGHSYHGLAEEGRRALKRIGGLLG
jgi:Ser/Thr protein kinase RdoA (MazF antagonist)